MKFNKPENCSTVWELCSQYGISKQIIYRAIKSGKLNAFMLGTNSLITLKWYIDHDELLETFLKASGKEKNIKNTTPPHSQA